MVPGGANIGIKKENFRHLHRKDRRVGDKGGLEGVKMGRRTRARKRWNIVGQKAPGDSRNNRKRSDVKKGVAQAQGRLGGRRRERGATASCRVKGKHLRSRLVRTLRDRDRK